MNIPTSQGSGDVSNRSEIQMNNGYHGKVATYSEYQKTTIRKYLTEGYFAPYYAPDGAVLHLIVDLDIKVISGHNPRSNIF